MQQKMWFCCKTMFFQVLTIGVHSVKYQTDALTIRPLCKSNLSSYRLVRKKYDLSKLKIFINEKFKNFFYFFTCILPYYVAHDQRFFLNSHFEKMPAGFLLRCQNLLFIKQKIVFNFVSFSSPQTLIYECPLISQVIYKWFLNKVTYLLTVLRFL